MSARLCVAIGPDLVVWSATPLGWDAACAAARENGYTGALAALTLADADGAAADLVDLHGYAAITCGAVYLDRDSETLIPR